MVGSCFNAFRSLVCNDWKLSTSSEGNNAYVPLFLFLPVIVLLICLTLSATFFILLFNVVIIDGLISSGCCGCVFTSSISDANLFIPGLPPNLFVIMVFVLLVVLLFLLVV